MNTVWINDDNTNIYVITKEDTNYHVLVKNKEYKTLTFIENFIITEADFDNINIYLLKSKISRYSSDRIIKRIGLDNDYFNILSHNKQICLEL